MTTPGRVEERDVPIRLTDSESRAKGRELARLMRRAAKMRAAEAERAKKARAEIRDVEGEAARLSEQVESGVEVRRMHVRAVRTADGHGEELYHLNTGELLHTGPADPQLSLAERGGGDDGHA